MANAATSKSIEGGAEGSVEQKNGRDALAVATNQGETSKLSLEEFGGLTERETAISQLYQEVLGREPDMEGLKYWAGKNLTIDEIRGHLEASPEALQRAGASS